MVPQATSNSSPDLLRQCTKCGERKPLTAYYTRQMRGRPYIRAHCKLCHRAVPPTHTHFINAVRSLRRRGVTGMSIPALRKVIGEPWDAPCYVCGDLIGPRKASLDHVYPVSRGGTHEPSNLRWTHRSCNQIKTDRTLDELVAFAEKVVAFHGGK